MNNGNIITSYEYKKMGGLKCPSCGNDAVLAHAAINECHNDESLMQSSRKASCRDCLSNWDELLDKSFQIDGFANMRKTA